MALKKKIFIADDDEAALKSLKGLLNLSDFQVEATTDARSIISMVKETKPQLILLDLLMPDLGGFEVCEMLHDDDQTRGIPIVIISAVGYFKDIKELVNKKRPQGVAACIAKPYKFKNLLKIIRKIIG